MALGAAISPRIGIVLVWLFSNQMAIAFDRFWMGLVGFFVLPWTTLAWAVCSAPVRGVQGFGWFLVILAFLADLSTYAGSADARRHGAESS